MKLFDIANKYCKTSNWKTIATLKFCLLSLGMIIGVLLPDSCKVYVLVIAGVIFIITYIPLIYKLIRLLKEK